MPQDLTAERAVANLYRAYPFPQTTAQQRREWLTFQLCKYKFLGVEDAWRGRVLDVGCGTGRTMLVPKHYGTQHYVGLDQSEASLQFARKVSLEDGVEQFVPLKASLFDMPFENEYFDLVVSWGVLHCTPDPIKGIGEMMRVCKPGGYIAFFVYNPFAHWRNNFQRWKIQREAGPDVDARFKVAHRMYGSKPIEQMTSADVVNFVDRFCVPIESNHTYGELMSWLDQLGLEYWGSSPPLRFRDFFRYLQMMADLMDTQRTDESSTKFLRYLGKAARLSRKLPISRDAMPPFGRPTIFHRAFWQAMLAWVGPRYGASIVSSFCGRKPPTRQ
jgi:SAM-dependent methyltransferase